MKYHFRFNNELKLFSEVGNAKKYEVIVLEKYKDDISFISICNLFHTNTIEACFQNNDEIIYSIRDKNDNWELNGNRKRLLEFNKNTLLNLQKILEPDNSNSETINLPLIHNVYLLETIIKTGSKKDKVKNIEGIYSTQMINETNGQKDGTMKKVGTFVDLNQFIFSGPHYYVATPFNKTPNENCSSHRDYSDIELDKIDVNFIPRTVFKLIKENLDYLPKDYYHIHRRRALNTNERTLIGCIAPPNIPHTNNSLSIHFKNRIELLSFSLYSSSIIYDFLIRISGNSDMWFSTIENLPYFKRPNKYIINRGLRLNVLSELYSELWNDFLDIIPKDDIFSKEICNNLSLKLIEKWNFDIPLRIALERRQALLEIDVLVAMELGLDLDELISIYSIQFPVLSSIENKLLFDKHGREVSSIVRKEYLSDTENNKVKSNYDGFIPPFIKVDRVEDYKVAWSFFKDIYNKP